MTFLAGDKTIILPVKGGKSIAIPYTAPAAGDTAVFIPDAAGNLIAMKYVPPVKGESCIMVPDKSGNLIALKTGPGTPPPAPPLSLRILYFPDTGTKCSQSNHLVWAVLTAPAYDSYWVEISGTGYSTNPGDGTHLTNKGAYGSSELYAEGHVAILNGKNYVTAWGMMLVGGVLTIVPASKSCQYFFDVSPVDTFKSDDWLLGSVYNCAARDLIGGGNQWMRSYDGSLFYFEYGTPGTPEHALTRTSVSSSSTRLSASTTVVDATGSGTGAFLYVAAQCIYNGPVIRHNRAFRYVSFTFSRDFGALSVSVANVYMTGYPVDGSTALAKTWGASTPLANGTECSYDFGKQIQLSGFYFLIQTTSDPVDGSTYSGGISNLMFWQ